ncbi:MAG: cobalt transport protein CbiN [Candidatus Methanomethylophilaceae archaeon]|nr:cobalt transport protein CbiN [Candidatus Methanomethylophilaceae archaeon]
MAESKTVYIAGFAIIALLVIAVLAYGATQDWEFGGADDGAEGVVEEVDPGYESWWNGIFGDYELPGETESMLFALQAAIGAIIIGYFIGAYTRKE